MFGFFGVYLHESQKKKLSPSKSSPFGEITRNSLKNESYIIYPCHSINVVNQLNHLKKQGPNHLVSHEMIPGE